MNIEKINQEEKIQYLDLLLIADEQIRMIEKYLHRGEMFVLYEGGVKVVCVVTREKEGVYEIKNISTAIEYQGLGYGQQMVSFIVDHYKALGEWLYVGTGDSPMTLGFYEKCGFSRSHVISNFFIDHYDHPIYENGQQLVDMIYLKRQL